MGDIPFITNEYVVNSIFIFVYMSNRIVKGMILEKLVCVHFVLCIVV